MLRVISCSFLELDLALMLSFGFVVAKFKLIIPNFFVV